MQQIYVLKVFFLNILHNNVFTTKKGGEYLLGHVSMMGANKLPRTDLEKRKALEENGVSDVGRCGKSTIKGRWRRINIEG